MNDENPTPSEQEPQQPGKKKPWMLGGQPVFPKSKFAVVLIVLLYVLRFVARQRAWHYGFLGGNYDIMFTIGMIVVIGAALLYAIKQRDDRRQQEEEKEDQGEKKELE
jgi:uncharacterized membrane protein